MKKAIRHVHKRRFSVSWVQMASALNPLYSDTVLDAYPRDHLRPWRKSPSADGSIVPGTRCGHGPMILEIVRWDGYVLEGDVQNRGFDGRVGLRLEPDGDGTILTHFLEAHLTLRMWLIWQLFAPVHDWVCEAIFDRLQAFFETGRMPEATPTRPPRLLRVPESVRRRIYRVVVPGARTGSEAEASGTFSGAAGR